VRRVLEDPAVVLAELRRQREGGGEPLDVDIQRLRREISALTDQERRLVKLYALGEIDDDHIRQHSGPLKVRRQGLEAELARLETQAEAVKGLDRVERNL